MSHVLTGRRTAGLIVLLIGSLAFGCSGGGGGGGGAPANPGVNSAPQTMPDAVVTAEDTPVTFSPTANDTDPDGDPFGIIAVTDPPNGTVTLNGGMVTYTPDPNFSGLDFMQYTVNDSAGNGAQDQINITVTPVNDPPTTTDDFGLVDEDGSVAIDVLMNDIDVEGDPITVAGFTQPPAGTVTAGPNDTLVYTPNANFCGLDAFQYSASDGNSISIAIVTVTVTCFNDPPSAADDAAAASENTPVDIDVLANDTDVDGDALSVTAVTQPMDGTTQIIAGDEIRYTPDPGFLGDDSFTYTIEDPSGESSSATVNVSVLAAGSLAFIYSGVSQTLDYNPGGVDLAFTVPFFIEEDIASTGFPNDIEAFTMSIGHDAGLLTATTVSQGADLAALGGGAGPELFLPMISDGLVEVSVVVSSTGGPFLVANGPQEALLVDYEGNTDLLAANTTGASTALSWTPGANDVTVGGVTVAPVGADVPVDLNPTIPSPGFYFYAPGQEVSYDLGTGVGAFTQSYFIFESVAGGGMPTETNGFSMSVAHDPSLITPTTIAEGPALTALNGGAGPDFFAPLVHPDGFCVGVVYDFIDPVTLTAENQPEVVTVDYDTVAGTLAGDADGAVSPLVFSDTIGSPPPGNNLSLPGGGQDFPAKSSGAIILLP